MDKVVMFSADCLLDKNKKLRESVVRQAREYAKRGFTVGVWADTAEYADNIRRSFDLFDVFGFAMAKPSVMIDEDDYPLRNAKLELPNYRRGQYV